jgi:plastocyanin
MDILFHLNDRKPIYFMNKAILLAIAAGMLAAVAGARAGDISGTVTIKGTPPKGVDIEPLKDDANCGKFHSKMPTTHFYVVGPKGELGDVVVSVENVTGPANGAGAAPAVLDQKGCEYAPSIFAVQVGQKIIIKNSDPVAHNVHFDPDTGSKDKYLNQLQVPNGPDLSYMFEAPGDFQKFKCDVHKWMFSWACVFPHPYFAVSGKDGTFKITGLPPGKYKVRAIHRKLGAVTQDVEVTAGAPAKADFVLEVK